MTVDPASTLPKPPAPPPLRAGSPLAQFQLPEPVTTPAHDYGGLGTMVQPRATYDAGFLVPYGQFYGPEQVQQAADTMGVGIVATPIPGAVMFTPPAGTAVVGGAMVLHGSEGGASGASLVQAANMASQGYAALAYSYFGVPGQPRSLVGVNVDQAIEAARWLRSTNVVDGRPVVLVGGSRGGEMGALVASLAPAGTFAAVALHSPQDRTAGAFSIARDGTIETPSDEHGADLAAWAHEGRPIPAGSVIEAECSDAPFFISEGENDEVWSADGARRLAQRLDDAGRAATLVMLPGEGHVPSYAISGWLQRRRDEFLERALHAAATATTA